MPKGSNQKFKLYRLAQIMLDKTDDEHYITMPEIMKALAEYEVTADRKSIYNDLRDLEKLGIEVEGEPVGKGYHYHVVSRPFELPEFFTEIIADELNVKNVTFTDDVSGYTTYTFKPQLRTVGPKYGKYLGQIQKALANVDGNKAMADVRSGAGLKLPEVGADVVLYEEDLLITMTQMEGYVTEGDNEVTVVLDTNLTPELLEEGFERELISKIQTMRKEAGFEVMDKIAVSYQADDKIRQIFEKYGDEIGKEVLAEKVTAGALTGYEKEWNINGEKVVLAVEKL